MTAGCRKDQHAVRCVVRKQQQPPVFGTTRPAIVQSRRRVGSIIPNICPEGSYAALQGQIPPHRICGSRTFAFAYPSPSVP